MANRRKDAKFFIYNPDQSGQHKGTRLLGFNRLYVGETPTVQDLLDFLKEKGVDPTDVPIDSPFITRTKPVKQ